MTSLGTCCICGAGSGSPAIVMLNQRSPISGRGWGCILCGLPANGAIAVVCGDCCQRRDSGQLAVAKDLRWACRGYPATDGRVPVEELTGTHEHDLVRHESDGTSKQSHGTFSTPSG